MYALVAQPARRATLTIIGNDYGKEADRAADLLKRPDNKRCSRAAATLCLRQWMELNGARSNPRAGVELSRLGALHDELLRRALVNPREPRPVPAKVSPVLETVTLVLERAENPMRIREIHAAACELVREPLLWKSVKAALSRNVTGEHPRFRRVRHGVYEMAERRPR